jgi:cobalamin biosynthesis protein CobW
MRHVLQAVVPRIERWYDKPWGPGESRRSALVVIAERARLADPAPISAALAEAVPA